jgi:hypothetical protein
MGAQVTVDDALSKLLKEVFESAIRQALAKVVVEARHSPHENKTIITGHLREAHNE